MALSDEVVDVRPLRFERPSTQPHNYRAAVKSVFGHPQLEPSQVVLLKTSGKNANHFFVEQRPTGDYAVRRGGAQRASAVEPTQGEAIDRAQEIAPKAPIHVERVRTTDIGKPDQWRKP